jgi:hypothetical protein
MMSSAVASSPSFESCQIPDLPPPPKALFAGAIDLPDDYRDVKLAWPVASPQERLNSPFGPRQLGSEEARYDWHRGLDLALPMGTQINAPADGVVVHAGPHPGYADTIVQLRHNDEEPYLYSLYLHLSDVEVSAGQSITKGSLIAHSGQGSATYPHLHWEVRIGCLRQECCENPYSYLEYANQPPAAPKLEASGTSPAFGRMLLVSTQVPKTEIDLQSMKLQWNGVERLADWNELNRLSPRGEGSRLDDPLFFHEEFQRPYVILPKRFNQSFDDAGYEILFFSLDGLVTDGAVIAGDGGGLMAPSQLSIDPPPVSLHCFNPRIMVEPGANVRAVFSLRNHDEVEHELDFQGISVQSLDLDVQPASAVLAPGASISISISASLNSDWAEDVGDVILLRATVDDGAYTDLIGASLVDTSENPPQQNWWLVY